MVRANGGGRCNVQGIDGRLSQFWEPLRTWSAFGQLFMVCTYGCCANALLGLRGDEDGPQLGRGMEGLHDLSPPR